MTRNAFVQRLISKRPLVFMGGADSFILRDLTSSCVLSSTNTMMPHSVHLCAVRDAC